MKYLYKILATVFSYIQLTSENISSRCGAIQLWLFNKSGNSSGIQESVERYAKDSEAFFHEPQELANRVTTEKYKKIAETYFLLKHATSLYEAHSKVLPIQVFNEMRNALDHFVRSLIQDGDEEGAHINKMEGHLQRALFDISKSQLVIMKKTILIYNSVLYTFKSFLFLFFQFIKISQKK